MVIIFSGKYEAKVIKYCGFTPESPYRVVYYSGIHALMYKSCTGIGTSHYKDGGKQLPECTNLCSGIGIQSPVTF